jgi:hypothetical protein
LVLGVALLCAQTGFAQVAGRVTESGGVLDGATVQVWDSYPGGSPQSEATSDALGMFALTTPGSGAFDLRVLKSGYYPTVVRRLPDGTTNTLVELVPLPAFPLTTDTWAKAWDDSSMFDGADFVTGDVILAYDADGVACGSDVSIGVGRYGFLNIYGNDPGLPGDQGAELGDEITFTVNGLDASVSQASLFWADRFESRQTLTVTSANIPGVTTVGESGEDSGPGDIAEIDYRVTNTGDSTETFTASAENDSGWTMIISTLKGATVTLDPGEFEIFSFQVLVPLIPLDVDTLTLEVRFMASADTYGSANSGAFTLLRVFRRTDVWDDQSGGGLLPEGFGLAQNYPNPFNPSTMISYSLGSGGHARLEVINIIGQSVRVLVDEYRPAGPSSVVWDGFDQSGHLVSTGIYFYRLVQGNQSEIRKMVLLK